MGGVREPLPSRLQGWQLVRVGGGCPRKFGLMGIVESVNLAVVRTGDWTGRVGRSGIDKRPAEPPVRFEQVGVCGDTVCDTKHHGAWYQAAYAFDREELAYWSK
ncbi:hypothetical protein [Saccharopolyspora spinosa]|uniref:hypothetical protein n=1 Tax=Saccharopolyspora spinosa TaxID=60894 RepID=UPI00031B75A5